MVKDLHCYAKRAIPALVTPFNHEILDLESLRRISSYVVDGGCTAVVVLGSTGEGTQLDMVERGQAIEAVCTHIGSRAMVVAGIGTTSTQFACRMAKQAAQCGADAVLVSTPHYVKATEEGVKRHYFEIAEATALPIILYNIPSRTGFNISLDAIAVLRQQGIIAAVKEPGTNAARIQDLKACTDDDFLIFCGDDDAAIEMGRSGAAGCISVVANAFPSLANAIQYRLALGDVSGARTLSERTAPLLSALTSEPNPQGIKFALNCLRLCEAHVRLPLLPCSDQVAASIREAVAVILDNPFEVSQ